MPRKRRPREATYSYTRANFRALCDQVAESREPLVIHRRGAEDVALVAADELRGLEETAHLLRSPNNARRLLTALAEARRGRGRRSSVEALRRELGLGEES